MARTEGTRRPQVLSRNGIVSTGHPLATAAGVAVLQKGGNAMDAAIAAALATTVVMPGMTSLGGDAFALYHEAATGQVWAINGSGIAPLKATREYFAERGYQKMPYRGPLSISVPGSVDVYFSAIERFGTMPPATLFEAAIRLADDGFPLTEIGSATLASIASEIAEFPTTAAIFLDNGRARRPGEILRQRNLARSLRLVAERGPDVFYRGELAEAITSAIQQAGGLLGRDEFAQQRTDIYQPISVDYRGYTVYQTGLPTQGHIVLEELNILENVDLSALGHSSADSIHVMVEAKKRAFADRLAYSGDPRFVDVPLETMLSKEFARSRFESIDMARATESVPAGLIPEHVGDTTYLCAIDRQGNAVSFIHSLSSALGSQFVAGETGIVLNNRAGRGFTLEEGHPNVIAPGKRTMHTLNCYLVSQENQVRWVGGTPGGDQQPQWNMQVLSNLIDHDMNPQAAVEAPRWHSFPGTDPINLPNDFVLHIEERVSEDALKELERRGHRVQRIGAWSEGGDCQVIGIDPESGVISGGADPRTEALALGY